MKGKILFVLLISLGCVTISLKAPEEVEITDDDLNQAGKDADAAFTDAQEKKETFADAEAAMNAASARYDAAVKAGDPQSKAARQLKAQLDKTKESYSKAKLSNDVAQYNYNQALDALSSMSFEASGGKSAEKIGFFEKLGAKLKSSKTVIKELSDISDNLSKIDKQMKEETGKTNVDKAKVVNLLEDRGKYLRQKAILEQSKPSLKKFADLTDQVQNLFDQRNKPQDQREGKFSDKIIDSMIEEANKLRQQLIVKNTMVEAYADSFQMSNKDLATKKQVKTYVEDYMTADANLDVVNQWLGFKRVREGGKVVKGSMRETGGALRENYKLSKSDTKSINDMFDLINKVAGEGLSPSDLEKLNQNLESIRTDIFDVKGIDSLGKTTYPARNKGLRELRSRLENMQKITSDRVEKAVPSASNTSLVEMVKSSEKIASLSTAANMSMSSSLVSL